MLSKVIKCYQIISRRREALRKLNSKQAAEKLGVSVVTLRRWDKKGILKAHRTLTNRCYYTEDQINKLLNKPNDDELKIAFSPVLNIGYLHDDGTITIESKNCSGTFKTGINYVFGKATICYNGSETTIKNIPTKVTIDAQIKKGESTTVSLELSQAAYRVILKAGDMHLLNGKDIEYFDLEEKVFASQNKKKEKE